jgi:SYP6 family syntaxin
MKQQDQGLDMLSVSVERLGQMSLGISEELGQQNKMLDGMETDLDTAAEDLDLVTRKTKEFIKLSGGTKNCVVIMSLTAVALILFFLILYT